MDRRTILLKTLTEARLDFLAGAHRHQDVAFLVSDCRCEIFVPSDRTSRNPAVCSTKDIVSASHLERHLDVGQEQLVHMDRSLRSIIPRYTPGAD